MNLHPLEGRNIGNLGSSGGHGTAQLGDSQGADLRAVVGVGPQINSREGVAAGDRRSSSSRASSCSGRAASGGSLGSSGTGNGACGRRLSGSRLALGVEVVDLDTLVAAGTARSAAPVLTTTLGPVCYVSVCLPNRCVMKLTKLRCCKIGALQPGLREQWPQRLRPGKACRQS